MSLHLYNSMTKQIEKFIPIKEGFCGFYGCGPTVYNYAHIGNLRAYVFLDSLDRILRFLKYDVKHVMNITDIGHLAGDNDEGEDKMLKTAQEKNQSVLEIADFYTKAFFNDIDKLNIRHPDITCKATEHIQDMIELIKIIEQKGHTYTSGGNLYFDVSTFKDYGKLARLNLDDLKAGARIAVDENKKNPFDFVLWFTKSKFDNQALKWDSPWGTGYPGWHIECSAMSMKYLGSHFDIHTGGIDHIPIHHTNEIAQSESASGEKWVNYWLHNEFLILNKEKMSKSGEGFLTLSTLEEKGYDALDYRFFLLGGHYRSQLAFSWEAMDSAQNARKALNQRIGKIIKKALDEGIKKNMITAVPSLPSAKVMQNTYMQEFITDIENDLSLPRALSQLQSCIKDKNIPHAELLELINNMDFVLGLDLIKNALQYVEDTSGQYKSADESTGNSAIDALVQERLLAKKQKNYARADEIRNLLKNQGIILIDTPEGTVWEKE